MNIFKLIIIPFFVYAFTLKMYAFEVSSDDTQMRININWTINQTGSDALYSKITFTPNDKTPTCDRLSFIQTAKVQTSPGVNYIWKETEGQSNRNLMLTNSGYFIDHDASKCEKDKKCSPFYRDSWENLDESNDGASGDLIKKEAIMLDAPFGWESFESIDLEACSICQNGIELKVLACLEWGGSWPSTSDRAINSIKFNSKPSKDFENALYRFINFYRSELVLK
jgi:hypothetical protein